MWTHSLYTSPRNARGLFAGNIFDTIGRDALQVGHAFDVRVEGNSGRAIGLPADIVDATPVAIDTAGNVERSVYARNRFRGHPRQVHRPRRLPRWRGQPQLVRAWSAATASS